MKKFEIDKLRSLPIESVAERLGLTVTKHKAICPFHQDSHPSLSFRVSTNSFKCFVCGAHGGVIDLAMHMLGKNFIETCEWLANENCIIIEKYPPAVKQIRKYPPDVQFLSGLVARPTLNEVARCFLFDQRHYNPKVIEWLGISSISQPAPCWRYGKPFYDAPSLLFPYKDIDGNVLNVQSRYLGSSKVSKVSKGFTPGTAETSEATETPETTKSIPRFRFPPNGSIHIFNLPILRYLKPNEPLFISEGITDCIAHLSSGHKAVAIPSATLLKPEDLEPLRGRELHVFPDNDPAGERMYQQLVGVATSIDSCLIRHLLPEGCKDFSDYYLKSINH